MKQNKLVVITSYPPKNTIHDRSIVGVASYAKNTLVALKKADKNEKLDVSVLAELLPGDTKTKKLYKENGITVKRIWKRNSLKTFPILTLELMKFHKDTKNVLIELELSMFGDSLHLSILPIFIIFLRLMRKNVTVVFHQVIPNIKELNGHINMGLNDKKLDLLNFLIHSFYVLMLASISKAIVFDEALKKGLEKFGNKKKIKVIPHGVETFNNIPTKKEARKKLNIPQDRFVLLYFGFIAWYKGTDWLVNQFSKCHAELDSASPRSRNGFDKLTILSLPKDKFGMTNNQVRDDKDVELIIAGGENPNHADKKYYQKYIENIKADCRANNIRISGFVNEKQIPLYFQACDAVIFPYRTFMSASGPLSFAFAFRKPFLVSDKLARIFKTEDVKHILEKTKINKESIIFELNNEFRKKISLLIRNEKFRKRLEGFAKKISYARSWKNIGKLYYEELI